MGVRHLDVPACLDDLALRTWLGMTVATAVAVQASRL